MAKILEIDKPVIIERLARGESYRKIGKDYGITSAKSIMVFKNKHITEIQHKQTTLQKRVKSIYMLALSKLEMQLKATKSQPQQLAQVSNSLFNQYQILSNKPTSISQQAKNYEAMSQEQLDTEAHKLVARIKAIAKARQAVTQA